MRYTAVKYRPLARKHGLDPWEIASAAFEVMLAPDAAALPPFVSMYTVPQHLSTRPRPVAGRIVITLGDYNPAPPYAATRDRYWARLAEIVGAARPPVARPAVSTTA